MLVVIKLKKNNKTFIKHKTTELVLNVDNRQTPNENK